MTQTTWNGSAAESGLAYAIEHGAVRRQVQSGHRRQEGLAVMDRAHQDDCGGSAGRHGGPDRLECDRGDTVVCGIELSVPDSSAPQQRLGQGYYIREIRVEEAEPADVALATPG